MKHPAVGKLTSMGVEFRPSVRYKVESTELNILKDPVLESVKAQVDSNRHQSRNYHAASPKSQDAPRRTHSTGASPSYPYLASSTSGASPEREKQPRLSVARRKSAGKAPRSRSFIGPRHAKMKRALASRGPASGSSSSTVSEASSVEGAHALVSDETAKSQLERGDGLAKSSKRKVRKVPSMPAKLRLSKREKRHRRQARSR